MTEEPQEVQEEAETVEPAAEPDVEPVEEPGEPDAGEPEDELAEDDGQTGGEPATEPEPVAVRSDREMEKVFRDIERLRKDVAGRVGRIFAEDANELMDCPLCASVAPGYLWPPDVAPLAEEQITALRLLLNMPVATDYKQSPSFEPCGMCDGMGRVRTGSKVQNHEIAECPRCFAKGYVPTAIGPIGAVNGNGDEQDASMSGPTVYGHELPQADPNVQSAIESLRDRGYMVVEPLQAPRPAV